MINFVAVNSQEDAGSKDVWALEGSPVDQLVWPKPFFDLTGYAGIRKEGMLPRTLKLATRFSCLPIFNNIHLPPLLADHIRLLELCASGEVLAYDLQRNAMLLITGEGAQLDVLWPVQVDDEPCDEPFLLFNPDDRAKLQAAYDRKVEAKTQGLGWKLQFRSVSDLDSSHKGEVPYDELEKKQSDAQ